MKSHPKKGHGNANMAVVTLCENAPYTQYMQVKRKEVSNGTLYFPSGLCLTGRLVYRQLEPQGEIWGESFPRFLLVSKVAN